jgi:hypothetical protein
MYIIKHDSYIKGFASSILLHIRIIYGERERERKEIKDNNYSILFLFFIFQ